MTSDIDSSLLQYTAFSGNTDSGYDTSSNDAVCWLSLSDETNSRIEENDISYENNASPLLLMMRRCFDGLRLTFSSVDFVKGSSSDDSEEQQSNPAYTDVSANYGIPNFLFSTQGLIEGDNNLFRLQMDLDNATLSYDDNHVQFEVQNGSEYQQMARMIFCSHDSVGTCTPSLADSLARSELSSDAVSIIPSEFYNSFEGGRYGADFEWEIPFTLPVSGAYSVIGHVEMGLTSVNTGYNYTFHVATSVPLKAISIFRSSEVIHVSTERASLGLFMIVSACIVFVYFLYQLRRHRHNNIMRLAQWQYLAMLVLCCFLPCATSSVVLLQSSYEVGCRMYPIINNLAFAMVFCIIIARCWRVYQLVSPLIQVENNVVLRGRLFGLFDRLVNWEGFFEKRKESDMNRVISDQDMIRLIFILFSPMLFASLLSFPSTKRQFLHDEDKNEGYYVCSQYLDINQVVRLTLFLLYQILLVTVAYLAKDLPSFLNETYLIFRLSWTNLLVNMLCGTVIYINIDENGSPDITVSKNLLFG